MFRRQALSPGIVAEAARARLMAADAAGRRFAPGPVADRSGLARSRCADRARHLAARAPAMEAGADRRARRRSLRRRPSRCRRPPRTGGRGISARSRVHGDLPPRPRAAVRRVTRSTAAFGHHVLTPLVAAGWRRGPGRPRLGAGGPGASGDAARGPARGPGRGRRHRPLSRRRPARLVHARQPARRRASGTGTTCRRSSARSASSCCRS